MEKFTANHARILVMESKFKQLKQIIGDIESSAKMGESRLFGSCELNKTTIDELKSVGFLVEISENNEWIIIW